MLPIKKIPETITSKPLRSLKLRMDLATAGPFDMGDPFFYDGENIGTIRDVQRYIFSKSRHPTLKHTTPADFPKCWDYETMEKE